MSRSIQQGFWATVTVYVGVILGYVNTVVFFPKFLTFEEIGLYRLIVSNAMILAPLAMLGFGPVLMKFYPYFRADRTQSVRLYTFSFFVPLIAFALLALLLYVLSPAIGRFFEENGAIYIDYLPITISLTLLVVLFTLLEYVARIHQSIVLPNFLKEVFMRIFAFLMAILVGLGILPFSTAIYIVLIHYTIALIVLLSYLVKKYDFKVDPRLFKIRPIWRKRILEFGGFSMLMGLSSVILLNIDQIFVTKYLGLRENGIYTLVFYIAIIIGIPRRVVTELVAPRLSHYFRDKKMDEVARIYRLVSIDQTLIGIVLLLGIIMSIEDLFLLIPKGDELQAGYMVVVIIAFTKLIEMTFSVNANIIAMSRLFRYNVLLISLFMLLNIVLNWLLIPLYGLNGAALASLVSALLFNMAKMLFVWFRFHMQPFSDKVLWLYLIGAAIFLLVREIPFGSGSIRSIGLRSVVIAALYFVPLYLLKVSPNLNYLVDRFLGIVKDRFGRST